MVDIDRKYDVAPFLGAVRSFWSKTADLENRIDTNSHLMAGSGVAMLVAMQAGATPNTLAAAAAVTALAVGRSYWYAYQERSRANHIVDGVLGLFGKDEHEISAMDARCQQFDDLVSDLDTAGAVGMLAETPELACHVPVNGFSPLACALSAGNSRLVGQLISMHADVDAPIRVGSENSARTMASQLIHRNDNEAALSVLEQPTFVEKLAALGLHSVREPLINESTFGKLVLHCGNKVAQSIGRGVAVVCDRNALVMGEDVNLDQPVSIRFRNGQGMVAGGIVAERGLGR
jgi:hypothetical protein